MKSKRIFLDNGSTTPVDPRVLEAMIPYFTNMYGNAASRTHSFGLEAHKGVQQAREHIASLINGETKNLIFTSGATEAINLAIKGFAKANKKNGNHIITTKIEHKAVLDSCNALESDGFEVSYLSVNEEGIIDPENLKKVINKKTILVSVMHVNNEIGTIQPIKEIAKICNDKKITLFVDGAQSVGKIDVDVRKLGVDLMSISAHKMYGPKGVGALYINSNKKTHMVHPQIVGGGHEKGLRSGTLNVPGIVGFGKAAEVMLQELNTDRLSLKDLQNELINGLFKIDGVTLNGPKDNRIPGNLNVCFKGVDAESLMLKLDNIALSSGSACTSGSFETSYVLKAIGLDDEAARSSIRFGIGRFNTKDDITITVKNIKTTVDKLRALSSLFNN